MVRADEAVTAERLRAQRIGRAPRIGQTLGITRLALRSRLARAAAELDAELDWRGPIVARVRATGQVLPPDEYVPVADAFLRQYLAERVAQHRVEPLATRTPLKLPFGAVDLRARLPAAATVRKRMSVWLDAYVDGNHYRSVPVWFAVDARAPGFVAAMDLDAGSTPGDAMVRPATIALTGQCQALADGARFDGEFRLRRPVAAGQPVCAEDLDVLPAVVRGDEVLVTARSGPVEVSAVAVALEDGEPGQAIDVRRDRRGERFEVVVTGVKQARVEGGERDD
jgi:flagella basal body P-ring formation protein FlgA